MGSGHKRSRETVRRTNGVACTASFGIGGVRARGVLGPAFVVPTVNFPEKAVTLCEELWTHGPMSGEKLDVELGAVRGGRRYGRLGLRHGLELDRRFDTYPALHVGHGSLDFVEVCS